MRALRISILAAAVALLAPAAASAHVVHTVSAGESLWSIAAKSNLTTRTVAVFNGLSENANVVVGTTIKIPSVAEGQAALAQAGIIPARTPAAPHSPAPVHVAPAVPASGAPRPLGAYVVRPGDTLSALAAQTGVPTAQMAYMNGLSADGAAADRHRPQAADRSARAGARGRARTGRCGSSRPRTRCRRRRG